MKFWIFAACAVASSAALAQQAPTTKEVLAAYCFGGLSIGSNFIAEEAARKCDGGLGCRKVADRLGSASAVKQKEAEIIRYLSKQGDPKRTELRAAVIEGATDMEGCIWSEIKADGGCSAFCARRDNSDQVKCLSACEGLASSQGCSFVNKCSDLSWMSPSTN